MLNLPNGAALAAACEGTLLREGGRAVTSAAIDSREVTEGSLFVAIVGERTDGHRYLTSAAKQGASAVLVETDSVPLEELAALNCSVVLCDSSVKALGRLSTAHKASCPAFTVAVTGSVGKTTTRQFIHAVLSQHFRTHKTEGNLNSDVGLPLTLLTLSKDHEASVVELGMSAKGEIAYLTRLVCPDLAIITTVGTSHIEYLGSREAIRDAKMEIAEGLKPGGRLLLNGDEPLLAGVPNAIYVALHSESADFLVTGLRPCPEGTRFDVRCPDRTVTDCFIPTLGEHTVLDAAFAVAVGALTGLTDGEIRRGLASFEGVGMRQRICRRKDVTFVMDYYNASPESIRAALAVTKDLASRSGGRTVAVLGSVKELGDHTEALHRGIGRHVASLPVDRLFTFGDEASFIAEEAITCGMDPTFVSVFPDCENAGLLTEALKQDLRPSDCVLLKASHSLRLERVTEALDTENY